MTKKENHYDRDKGMSPIPLILGILVLIFLGIYYAYPDEINNEFGIWSEKFEKMMDDGGEQSWAPEAVYDEEDESNVVTIEADTLEYIEYEVSDSAIEIMERIDTDR